MVIAVLALLLAILVPSLARAKRSARGLLCLTRLHGMGRAMQLYTSENDGHYPLAYHSERIGRVRYNYAWDFTHVKDWDTREERLEPGLLWQGQAIHDIHQCPSFDGPDNWLDDPHTGYNYNTSYLGYNEKPRLPGSPPITARASDVHTPAKTALFGDGQYAAGANKFMRAPWRDWPWDTFVGRSAGTQGYRHLGRTNVCWADGHAVEWQARHRRTHPDEQARIPPNAPYGFLSVDNRLYDLE